MLTFDVKQITMPEQKQVRVNNILYFLLTWHVAHHFFVGTLGQSHGHRTQ